jgi:hypothetical protein
MMDDFEDHCWKDMVTPTRYIFTDPQLRSPPESVYREY